jgi:hypothetical protein
VNLLNVLIVVDTEGALASGSLADNCYLVDTNGYLGSWQEGTDQLHSVCQDGQLIRWNAASVSPSGQVAISGFTGPMVDQAICVPTMTEPGDDPVWTGRVQSRGAFASFAYTATLSIQGKELQADCFLKVA